MNSEDIARTPRPKPLSDRLHAWAEAQQNVTATVGTAFELPDVANRVLSAIVKMIPCDTASLFLRYGDVMRVCAVHNLPAEIIGAEYALAWPLAEQMMMTRSPVWLDDVQSDVRVVAVPDAERVRGWLAAPLIVGERMIGQVSLGSLIPASYGIEEAEVLEMMARQAALALENAQLYSEATRRLQQMATLNEISSAALSTLDFDEIAHRLALALRRALKYENLTLWMATDTGGHLGLRPVDTDSAPIAWGHGLVGQAAAQGRSLWMNDSPQNESEAVSLGVTSLRSQLCVPMRIGERVIGVIETHSFRPSAFNDADVHLLSIVAGQLAGAAVGQLAAGVAHEINNPLTTISGFSELLLSDLPQDNPMRNDLTLIRRESQRARDVVRRLLDFARQTGPHSEPADMNDVVRDTVALMRNAAATKHVRVTEDYARDLPWARMDVNQFKQVVLNLLNNSMQAMPKGGMLTVTTEPCERDGKRGVCLLVTDTGVGIPPEHMERIFEPFFTTKPTGEGTGLGLAVSYGIVREHGGWIKVTSAAGRTTFTVSLPIERVDK
ncbi:MAG: GAF domain-containing protein [Chloroflexi bacterium]|nr:GAF domain-containing protein [Chloroflexota bacterium]